MSLILDLKRQESRSDFRMGSESIAQWRYMLQLLKGSHSLNKYLLSSYSVSGPGEQDRQSPGLVRSHHAKLPLTD